VKLGSEGQKSDSLLLENYYIIKASKREEERKKRLTQQLENNKVKEVNSSL
jgi:hypothetical protein